jgi:hypothetical protein
MADECYASEEWNNSQMAKVSYIVFHRCCRVIILKHFYKVLHVIIKE